MLFKAWSQYGVRLNEFTGGNLRNAIAREAEAVVLVNQTLIDKFNKLVEVFNTTVRLELKTTEPDLEVKVIPFDRPYFVIDEASQRKLINVLYACPHGVIEMSRDIPNFVETSTNLASVKTEADYFYITTSQRSSVQSSIEDIATMIASVFKLVDADIDHTDGYPGWTPNPKSEILEIARSSFRKLYDQEAKVLAVHAGLECGLIGEKFPGMDMISYGPDLRGVHSPDERIHIKSVERFWDLTLEILKNIPVK